MTTPAQILQVLAALAPDTKSDRAQFVESKDQRLLPFNAVPDFERGSFTTFGNETTDNAVSRITTARIAPLVRRAKLHDDERLRIGWLWVSGVDDDGDDVHFPLVSAAVRRRGLVDKVLSAGGIRLRDREVTELIADPADRDRLEASIQYGGGATDTTSNDFMAPALLARLPRLKEWALDAAAASGFPTQRFVSQAGPESPREPGRYEVRAQLAIYLAVPRLRSATVAATLRTWPERGLDETAFAACYGLDRHVEPPASHEPLNSPLVLSPPQRDSVIAARTDPVTVVSGPPGTGKSHTIAALALDEVSRGRSVLIAAPTEAAVDALTDLLTHVPGPDPVVFGSSDQRDAAADRLAQGGGALIDDDVLHRSEAAARAAERTAADLRTAVDDLLRAEISVGGTDPATRFAARRVAPRWFDGADLDEARRLLAAAATDRGWLARFRRGRRLARLGVHAGATPGDLAALGRALDVARAERHARELDRAGGLDLSASWGRLIQVDDERRHRQGEWLEAVAHGESRVGRSERATMARVAAALRAGRLTRRQKLAEIDGHELTSALPLWVGTLRDIDDLLPLTAGMFDLVVVDEASQVDQIVAAPALLRARRAVVVGDPKQLRHVSFLSEATIATAIDSCDIVDHQIRGLLDVRRMSLFDLAAARAKTRFLDEHFRSAPHLIGFSARRFYEGALGIATMHPSNHDRDCISVRWVDGDRGGDGANHAEVDAVIDLIRERQQVARRARTPARIGVVAPFRAQADAIEARIVDEFDLAEIDELGLRVGTVHGFQGCERDLMIVSPAVDASSTGSQRAFMNDRNLFNVMVTRAREEIVIVTSLGRDTSGLIGEYLRYGDSAPSGPSSAAPAHPLARRLASELRSEQVALWTGYPVGHHVVDLVIGSGQRALGVVVGVHPDGPEAHVERQLALMRAGWEIREVFESAWSDRETELAVELAVEARHRS